MCENATVTERNQIVFAYEKMSAPLSKNCNLIKKMLMEQKKTKNSKYTNKIKNTYQRKL